MSEILFNLSSSSTDDRDRCLQAIEASQQRLTQPLLDMSTFSVAVLFNMRAGRYFVECMFLKHHLGAVKGYVTEKRLYDFTSMLKWTAAIQQRSPEFDQNEKNTRMISLPNSIKNLLLFPGASPIFLS